MPNKLKGLLDEFEQVNPLPAGGLKLPQIWARYGSEWVDEVETLTRVNGEFIADVYELLFMFSNLRQYSPEVPTPDALAIVTTGWGAPLGDNGEVEGRPSEHASRFRVGLVIGILPNGSLMSRMRFLSGDQVGETTDDEGLATGALAEAADLMAFRVWGSSYTRDIITRWTDGKDSLPEEELRGLGVRVARFVSVLLSDDDLGEEVEQ